ncbi:MAG: polyhydroxyalkanoate synthesis regulator DNA-binding domain-containing protein [Myxococcota bacterium]
MIIIKKYGNRRLYDTTSSAYVNLQQIADRIREGHRIQVIDAKEGDDLTQQTLLQILLELQGTKLLLPPGLLHRMIRSTTDNPVQRMAMTQLATGLQMLDQQLEAFEGQTGWIRPDHPPPVAKPEPTPQSSRKRRPPPPPDPVDDDLDDDDGLEEDDDAPDTASKVDGELDDLRARLAALEKRLTGKK